VTWKTKQRKRKRKKRPNSKISSQQKILRAVYLRVHAVRVAAIYQQSKSQQAATKKRAALSFHSAVRLFVYTFGRFAEGVCIKHPIHEAAFHKNALQFRRPTGVRRSERLYIKPCSGFLIGDMRCLPAVALREGA
jgi:hypothetical protein